MNFWHIFDSGLKFEILKPNSSWLTFGISKFVSLSISRFLFLFLQLFFTLCCHIPTLCYHFGYYILKLLSFQLLHLKLTTFGYHISKLLSFWLLHLKITLAISFQIYHFLTIPPQNLFFIYCIKLNIHTNHHVGHYSCKSQAVFTLTNCCSVLSTTGSQSKTAFSKDFPL